MDVAGGIIDDPDDPDDPVLRAIIDGLSTTNGERQNLMFPCSEDTEEVLPGVLSYLQTCNYTVKRIVETVLLLQ